MRSARSEAPSRRARLLREDVHVNVQRNWGLAVGHGRTATGAAIALGLLLTGCTPELMTELWTEYQQNDESLDDWTGGDGTFSVELPDGPIAWLFSHTYLRKVNEDGTRSLAPPPVNNSLVVQAENGGALGPTLTGSSSEGFLEKPGPGVYWIMDGVVAGSSLWVFVNDPTGSDSPEAPRSGIAEVALPSLTPTVLKRRPTHPASSTPSLTAFASSRRCMLQVLPSYHMAAMPTWAFCMSASVRPVP